MKKMIFVKPYIEGVLPKAKRPQCPNAARAARRAARAEGISFLSN